MVILKSPKTFDCLSHPTAPDLNCCFCGKGVCSVFLSSCAIPSNVQVFVPCIQTTSYHLTRQLTDGKTLRVQPHLLSKESIIQPHHSQKSAVMLWTGERNGLWLQAGETELNSKFSLISDGKRKSRVGSWIEFILRVCFVSFIHSFNLQDLKDERKI